MQLSIAIMAHPRRSSVALELVESIGLPADAIAFDPFPDEKTSALPAAVSAWSRVDRSADWHVVLMDDASVCEQFRPRLEETLSTAQGPLSLYNEWGSRTAALARVAVLSGRGVAPVADPFVPTLGMAMPADLAAEFPRHYPGRQYIPEDIAIGRFLASRGLSGEAITPTLLQHDLSPSLIGNDVRGLRRSTLFVDDVVIEMASERWAARDFPFLFVPYIRYRDLALHVLTSVDGKNWLKLGYEAWLHLNPGYRRMLTSTGSELREQLRKQLTIVDPEFAECGCAELVGRYLALLAGCLESAPGAALVVDSVSEAVMESVLPGLLRIYHAPERLSGQGEFLLRLVDEVRGTMS